MAKVSSATIRFVQKMNRKNKNGEYPIYVVVGLASLMSRSPNSIATYVHQLTNDEEIASMVESMVI